MTGILQWLRADYCTCHAGYKTRGMLDPACESCSTKDDRAEAADEIERPRDGASRWIPVSDRLPTREDADADYLVCIRYQDGRTALRSIYMAPNDSAEYGKPVAWLPIPPYEPPPPPKPGPTDAECEILHAGMAEAVVDGERTEPIIRHWFADVTARIEKEGWK